MMLGFAAAASGLAQTVVTWVLVYHLGLRSVCASAVSEGWTGVLHPRWALWCGCVCAPCLMMGSVPLLKLFSWWSMDERW